MATMPEMIIRVRVDNRERLNLILIGASLVVFVHAAAIFAGWASVWGW